MVANNKMQPDFALPQLASFAEPPTTFGEANSGVAVNLEMTDDQLARFMTRSMTLHSSSAPKVGSFVGWTARFNGTRREQELQKFILNIKLYKDVEGINDEMAVQELPLLVEGEAATWWTGVKENIYNWSEVLKTLQREITQKKPAHQIYAEIFAAKQDE